MPKSQFVDPEFLRKSGKITFNDIALLAIFYSHNSHICCFVDVEWFCIKIAAFIWSAAINCVINLSISIEMTYRYI